MIRHNTEGINISAFTNYPNQITQNDIEFNGIGIKTENQYAYIYCNKICNNSNYDFFNNQSSAFNIANNYWCTSDSSIIETRIYDGYDNVSLGLVSFMPIDTLHCYLTTPINEIKSHAYTFTFFPNPVFNYLNLNLRNNLSKAKLNIYNLLGELEYTSIIVQQKTNIDVSTLSSGMHIIEVAAGDNISRGKFIKQKNIR